MRPSEPLSPDWMDARIEAYLDDELPAGERARFEQGLAAGWDAELFLARQIRDGLRVLPEPACPPHVAEAVLARIRRQAQEAWTERLRAWAGHHVTALWQPALAMSVLLLLVVSAVLVGRPTPPPPTYAAADVEQALAEVKVALGYLGEAGRHTGKVVRDDVIAQRVVGRMQHALKARHQPSDHTQQ